MLKSEASLSSYCDPVTVVIDENLERTVTIGDSIDGGEFSFAKLKEEEEEEEDCGEGDEEVVIKKLGVGDRDEQGYGIERPPSPSMHLAAGLGIDKFDLSVDEIKFDLPGFADENCGDYYKGMLEEYPLHPLLLNNYANFLEYKGDLSGAEEYYHKCTVVEPCDGFALANYGRLVMKLHKDEAKAMSYFERAVQASPEDSNVLGAYASFLWEINDDEEEDSLTGQGKEEVEAFSIQVSDVEFCSIVPGKKKPDAAEKSSSSLSKTEDGETLCRYAKAFWTINGDHEKALVYFEKAVEASPNDSIILGEYARFLWEIEE